VPTQRGFDSPDEQPKRKLYNPEALPSEHALDTPKAKDKNTRRKKEVVMDGVKLVVIYPRPTDVERFEKVYTEEHIPMAIDKLAGKTKIVASKVLDSPDGTPLFYRIAEIHFASREALNACTASEGAQATIAHAESISTGGKPIFLVAEEETIAFGEATQAAA
jgi:uncharacterized protein (TIGR02118 family)